MVSQSDLISQSNLVVSQSNLVNQSMLNSQSKLFSQTLIFDCYFSQSGNLSLSFFSVLRSDCIQGVTKEMFISKKGTKLTIEHFFGEHLVELDFKEISYLVVLIVVRDCLGWDRRLFLCFYYGLGEVVVCSIVNLYIISNKLLTRTSSEGSPSFLSFSLFSNF